MIRLILERPGRRGAEPKVPVKIRRDLILSVRPGDALRPDGAVAPDVNFGGSADYAGLDHLDRAAQGSAGATLIAHLRGNLLLLGELPELASPFYHQLHIVQLQVMHFLTGEDLFLQYAERWESYRRSRSKRTRALCYKAVFKICHY